MNFVPGDKVSFINEKQEGIIKRILSDTLVIVEIEDGFDIQVNSKELIKKQAVQDQYSGKHVVKEPLPEIIEDSAKDLLTLTETDTLALASYPAKAGAVLTGTVKFAFLNNSTHITHFVFGCRLDGKWRVLNSGISDPETLTELWEESRENLFDVEKMFLQFIAYDPGKDELPVSLRKEIALQLPDLSATAHSIRGVIAFARIIPVHSFVKVTDQDITLLKEKLSSTPLSEKHSGKKHESYINQGIHIHDKVVDLHIEELINDFSGLTNADMIQIQMKSFAQEMDNAIKNHYKKIVFIHGVGKGRLKDAVRNELENYKGVQYRDADYAKYGYGATEVILQ
jgi:hypothetical protein